MGHNQTEQTPIEDDRMSAASLPVQSTTAALQQTVSTGTGQTHTTMSSVPPSSSLPMPALPSIPRRIQENVGRGEYIDFTTILPKAMFGAQESQSQTLTLQLSQVGDNSPSSHKVLPEKITSFGAWIWKHGAYIWLSLWHLVHHLAHT